MVGGLHTSRGVNFLDTRLQPSNNSPVTAGSAIRNLVRLAAAVVSVLGFSLSAYALTPQTITFPVLANTPFTSPPPTPAATASSGLPVSYASNSPGVCTIAGSTISFVSAGTCSITASQAGNATYAPATPVTRTFNVTKGVNTITFPALANTPFTSPPPTPAATASSGLPVSYASTTTGVCTIAGSTISFVKAGTCSIKAMQAGNATYAPATPVTQSFSVTSGANTITFPALANTPFTSPPPTPAATASSGLPVSYASNSPGVCTIAGSTISFVSAGACSITASQAGNATYAPATPVTQSFSVTAGVNTITFPALANTPFTSPPPTPAATASSGLPVSYASTSTGVCTIAGSTISFVSAGACSITASQAGNATYAPATPVTQSFSVTAGVNTITFPALANTPFTSPPPTPAATASSGLPVSYASTTTGVCTIAGSTISFVAAGTCSITASQAGNANYAAATPVTRTFNVTKGVNTITFPALANTPFTSPPPTPAATASSGLPVSYASTTTGVCTIAGSTISFVKAGTCSIKATQAGNANYAAATAVTQSFSVTAVNTITFPALANTPFTSPPPTPAATASSGLPVSYASTTTGVCTIAGSTISFVSAGACSITASQAGNATYAPATPVTQSFSVTAGVNTITFPALANTPFTSPPPTPAATASSGLPVSYASTTTGVCTIAGSTISFVSAGTCSITASQAGNATYAPATPVTQSFSVTAGVNTITFPALANTPFTSPPPTPAATASSGLPVSYASNSPGVCTIAGSTISFVSAGACSITASQAGNATYAPATPVTQSFSVTAGVNTITFPALAQHALHQPAADAGGDGQFGPSGQLRLDHDRRVHHRRLDDQLRLGGRLLDHGLAGRQRHLCPRDAGDPELQRHLRRQHDHLSGARPTRPSPARRRRPRRRPVRAFRSATPRPRPACAPSPARRSASSRRAPARSRPRRPATPPMLPRRR